MSIFGCNCRCSCTAAAAIVSAILGVLAAFFQITAVITVTPVFALVALGIAVVYLGVLVVTTALARRGEPCRCLCNILNTVLTGILGTILFATSVLTAILVGLLVFFFALTLTGSACLVRCLADCEG